MEPGTKVNTLAIIVWVIAALLAIAGVIMAVGSFAVNDVVDQAGLPADEAAEIAAAAVALAIITAVFCIIFAALYFLIGRGLWNRRNWARILALVLSWIGLVGLALNLLLSSFEGARIFSVVLLWFIVFGAFEAMFIWWLQFDKDVVVLFEEPAPAKPAAPAVAAAKAKTVKAKSGKKR